MTVSDFGVRFSYVALDSCPASPQPVPATASAATVSLFLTPHVAASEDWTSDASGKAAIEARLATWAESFDAAHIIYWVGHGAHDAEGGYRIALADTQNLTHQHTTLNGRDVLGYLIAKTESRLPEQAEHWVVLILDTCASGEGVLNMIERVATLRNVAVVATTGEGAAFSQRFPRILGEVLAGYDNDEAPISVRELVRRIGDQFRDEGAGTNRVAEHLLGSAYLPPRKRGVIHAPGDIYTELRAHLDTLPVEVGSHFLAKARGDGEASWYFEGRENERRELVAWLTKADQGLLAITGAAGSGKSSLLGMMVASADEKVRTGIGHLSGTAIPADMQFDGTFDAVMHLRGMSIHECVDSLASDLNVDLTSAPEPSDAVLHALADRNRPVTLLFDALDESRDPELIAALLRRVARTDGVKVLVGTRRSITEDPDNPKPQNHDLLRQLSPDLTLVLGREPEAIRRYVTRRLSTEARTVLSQPPEQIAGIITDHGKDPFLFARLAVHEILADPHLADPERLAQLLAANHRGIFAQAVDRLTQKSPATGALLHALAYARGEGFPRTGDIWVTVASTLLGIQLTDADVQRALDDAAPYVTYSSEHRLGVYRLAHRTFAEYFFERDSERDNQSP